MAADRRVGVLECPAESLQRELELTKELLAEGHSLDEIGRRRPGVLIALAQERVLTASEAAALRRWFEVLAEEEQQIAQERYNVRAERERLKSSLGWYKQQERNAKAWGRLCAELGNALGRIAELVGEPGLEQDPHALVARVAEEICSKS